MKLKLYTCTDHKTHYPVGCASIVLAEDEEQAKNLLEEVLGQNGLGGGTFTLQEVETKTPGAVILCDGNY